MLNIMTYSLDDENVYDKILKSAIYLVETEEIEREFLNLFNRILWEGYEGPKFDTPLDLKILKEIDNAERIDLLTVKTHIGIAPLSCLSTGCKFALLVHYYSKKNKNIIMNWYSAGENVFRLLSRELDLTLFMKNRDCGSYDIPWDLEEEAIFVNGFTIEKIESSEIWKENYIVTADKLKRIHKYHPYFNERECMTYIPFQITCDYIECNRLMGKIGRYSNYTLLGYAKHHAFLKELHYDIRTWKIKSDTGLKYPQIWVFKKHKNSYSFTITSIYKRPNFFDTICELDEIWRKDKDAEEIILVFFDTQEDIVVDRKYTKHLAYSLIYEPEIKNLQVIGKRDTVKKLDKIANESEIIFLPRKI